MRSYTSGQSNLEPPCRYFAPAILLEFYKKLWSYDYLKFHYKSTPDPLAIISAQLFESTESIYNLQFRSILFPWES